MNHRLAVLALASCLAAGAARADTKVGYVDFQRALNEVDEGKAARAQLKKDFDEKQKKLDEKQDELKKLKADFDKQAVVMTEQVKSQKQAELEQKFMAAQQLLMQLQKDLSEREREVTRGIFDKMNGITREIAEADGFTVVLERNEAGIVWAQPALDLTNELVRKYNARFPGGAKKAEPAKPAPAAPAAPKK